jgi:hypothetical protein
LSDTTIGRLRVKFYRKNTNVTNEEGSQINNLSFYLKKLTTKEQTKPKERGGEKIIKVRAEINGLEKKYREVNETGS